MEDRIEPIIFVSPLIRKEAVPVFFTRARFHCDWMPFAVNVEKTEVADFARIWTKKALRNNVKHIRYFQSKLYDHDDDGEDDEQPRLKLRFSFAPESGLQLETKNLSAESDNVLQKHVAEVEATRKALRLQSEAIILALTGKPELWVKGALQ